MMECRLAFGVWTLNAELSKDLIGEAVGSAMCAYFQANSQDRTVEGI